MTFKELITSKGYNAKSLAAKVVVHEHTISNYIHGKFDPSFAIAIDISNALGVTLEELAESLGYRVK